MQTVYTFLKKIEQQNKMKLSNIEKIATYIACAGHDAGHIGLENPHYQDYMNFKGRDLTKEYPYTQSKKEPAVFSLEVMHAELTIKLVKESGIISHFSKEDQKKIYHLIKTAIERTDNNYHFVHDANMAKIAEELGKENMSEKAKEDAISVLVHAADVSNPAKPFEVYKRWAIKVVAEFLHQGELEEHYSGKIKWTAEKKQYQSSAKQNLGLRQQNFIKFLNGSLFKGCPKFIQDFAKTFGLDYFQKNVESNYKLMEDEKKFTDEDLKNSLKDDFEEMRNGWPVKEIPTKESLESKQDN